MLRLRKAMLNLSRVDNGYISSRAEDIEFVNGIRRLKLTARALDEDLSPEARVDLTQEILSVANLFIGNSFKLWVVGNYDDGRGPLSNLMLNLLKALNNKIGATNLISMIAVEESRLSCFLPDNRDIKLPNQIKPISKVKLLQEDETLVNDDLYRLISMIGPINLGRILLLLDGGKHYE